MTKSDAKSPKTPASSSERSSGKTRKMVNPEKPQAKSQHSALHEWSPAVNRQKAAAIEEKKHTFACAVGAAASSKKRSSSASQAEETKTKDFKADIVGELSKLMSIYKAAGVAERGKVMGYQRAISNIKTYAKPITNADQMDEIPFVGDGIKRKVREFLAEGKMTKLENLRSDPKLEILEKLSKIWGVGPAAANKLYSSGIRSIEELKKKQSELLTTN